MYYYLLLSVLVGEPDKDGEPDKKSKVPVQKGKAFSKGKEKSSVKAVKAEEDFHDATDEEKDLDNGKGRSKVAKAKGKGSKGKDKGSSEKVERVETKETKGKGGKSGKGKSGSGKSGKGGKAKSRESREKDFTEEKQETSKDDSNEAAKDRGSMAETSMDHFGAKLSASGCDFPWGWQADIGDKDDTGRDWRKVWYTVANCIKLSILQAWNYCMFRMWTQRRKQHRGNIGDVWKLL